jgi:hypothetical protein
MHETLLTLHSLLRWVVVLAAFGVVGRALMGLSGKQEWSALDSRLAAAFTHGVSLQFVIGLILHLFVSPITTGAFADFGAAMKDRIIRFWTVEHLTMMTIGLALVHIGSARVRKALPTAKHKTAALFFGLAIVVIMIAIPWPNLSYGRPLFRLFS